MANPEHLKRLKRSFEEWNQWRQGHIGRPDLSDAVLRGRDLRGVNLHIADLSHADLSAANLSGLNLSFTPLMVTNLRLANLNGTDLEGAVLSGAILIGTHLDGANFTKTCFDSTIFVDVDLTNVKGLETAIHLAPSSIDINSVILPHDEQTRNHFLRGVGFTETQIEYLPSLLTPRPIEYRSLFISYSSKDDVIAKRLYTDLRKKDVPCWFAPHDLQPGNYFRDRIDQAIHTQDKLLLLLSEHSTNSGWVRYEVELALSKENDQQREILYPIRLDNAIFDCTASWVKSLQSTRHIGNFTGWQDKTAYQQAFTTLLGHLKATQSPTHRSASS